MRRLAIFMALISMAWPGVTQNLPPKPPLAPARPITTTYFGVDVVDPYRYMENLDDPAVQTWISAQNDYASATLEAVPGRAELLAQLQKIEASEPGQLDSVVVLPEEQFFYLKEEPGQDSYNLYRRYGLSGKEVLLANPDAGMPAGSGHATIAFFSPSFDGNYVAYAVSPAGDRHAVLRVVDAETGKPLPDTIADVGFPKASWLPDGRSFIYARAEKPASSASGAAAYGNTRLYLHRLGADPSSDVPVFGPRVTPKLILPAGEIRSVETAPGSNYVVAAVKRSSDGNLVLYAATVEQAAKAAGQWNRIGNDNVTILDYRLRGNELFASVTGLRGPVIARVPLQNPGLDNWGLLLQFSPEQAITGLEAAADAVYLTVVQDAQISMIRVPYKKQDEAVRVALPFRGSVGLYDQDPRVEGVLAMLASAARAPAIYRYDSASDAMVPTALRPSGPYDDPSNVISANVTALSPDGTLVPLTIVYEKGLQLDGTHPTLLMVNGVDSPFAAPVFQPSWRVWLDRGGVVAFAQISLPDRIQDFLSCAHYLIDQGYTTPARLAAMGKGLSAILVGRAITEEPGLFRAVVMESGLLDPLRWLGPSGLGTNGEELGNTKTLEGFRSLESLSAYDYVDSGVRYPAVLLEAARDAQIPQWQSAKMAARLQADSISGLPILLSTEGAETSGQAFTEMGNGERLAGQLSFLLWQLGAPGFQPPQPAQ